MTVDGGVLAGHLFELYDSPPRKKMTLLMRDLSTVCQNGVAWGLMIVEVAGHGFEELQTAVNLIPNRW